MTAARRNITTPQHGAISLLETTIAVGILGIGLIMVAAVFPVALSQHRDATERVRSIELTSKAQAMLQSRLSTDKLWLPRPLDPNDTGKDTPWYLLPSTNLCCRATTWDWMPALAPPTYTAQSTYANVISGVTDSEVPYQNATFLTGLDTLSDRLAPYINGIQSPPSPFTDSELANAPNRLVWYGFYRRLGGKFAFCTAICRQQRDQVFVEQDLTATAVDTKLVVQAQNPFSTPTRFPAVGSVGARRLPVPWRISVGYQSPNILFDTPSASPPFMIGAGYPLGRLAPPGSKIMIQGTVRDNSASPPTIAMPVGRVLTVADVLYDAGGFPSQVEIVEDISDLPPFIYAAGRTVTFDVWLFPPALSGDEFEKASPLIEWKSLL
ncbi:MAG TPA: hypothetical protein VMV94_10640 [Phycisphaerae bacterium]|nr:hypothetical protein [Phycisphaerae bacterium]